MADKHTYRMTISLDVLDHLGVGLYSNVPAVLSETVANAWDADATRVKINAEGHKITIEDNGHGMSIDDANARYLRVGYKRRPDRGGKTPRLERSVMGRKGIGKLSLFSIARTVTVYSVKDGQLHGFRMDSDRIRESISGDSSDYNPDPADIKNVSLDRGTRIVLTNLKGHTYKLRSLRKRLARRFSVIGEKNEFEVVLNGEAITTKDRAYHEKLQYVWTFGDLGEEDASKVSKHVKRPREVKIGESTECIDGWIGTLKKAGDVKDPDTGESINSIWIMVRGKMAQEDILEKFGEGGVYSKYIIGEIHADFLDQDDKEDIATTGRQQIIEEDPRYQALMEKIGSELKFIQTRWTELRNEGGTEVALEIPAIKEWYDDLTPGHRDAAKKLFGRINQLVIDSDYRKQLLVGGIILFETLKFKDLLDRLDDIKIDNLDALGDIFEQLDELEANAYYRITKDRLNVIRKLSDLVDDDALERTIQKYLFDHLWLLDPSWERATHTERMESSVMKAFEKIDATLTEEQRKSRLDIKYTATGNKHVIVELKRPGRVLNSHDIEGQIKKYLGAVTNVLRDNGRRHQPVEFVCILGKRPNDWDDYDDAEDKSRNALANYNARIVMYDELIENAQNAYLDYTEKESNVTRLHKLLERIAASGASTTN